jgi:hypothetical protein
LLKLVYKHPIAFCRAAKGIESHRYVAMRARKIVHHDVAKHGITNVELIKGDFSRRRFLTLTFSTALET